MDALIDAITAVLWLAGASFCLLAALGVLRMPDVFMRMQTSTKASTLGLGCLLLGAAFQVADVAWVVRLTALGAFVFLTTPVSTHVIARAAYLQDVPLWEGTVLDERREDADRIAAAASEQQPTGS